MKKVRDFLIFWGLRSPKFLSFSSEATDRNTLMLCANRLQYRYNVLSCHTNIECVRAYDVTRRPIYWKNRQWEIIVRTCDNNLHMTYIVLLQYVTYHYYECVWVSFSDDLPLCIILIYTVLTGYVPCTGT